MGLVAWLIAEAGVMQGMARKLLQWGLLALAGCGAVAAPSPATAHDGEVLFTVYRAQNATDRLADIVRTVSADFRDSQLTAATLGYAYHRSPNARWELEAQLVKHSGMQHHWETNAVVAVRWMHFPWDRWLDTRFAFGEGLSYAWKTPPLEPRGDEPGEGESSRLLNYLLLEWEFVVPGQPEWSSFLRLHHRSGVNGLFGGVQGGSNFVGVGVRYTF